MQRYGNLSGDSGVTAFETGADFIKVQFKDGDTYTYTAMIAGAQVIARMMQLAQAGRGLATFINTSKPRYAKKG